MNVSRIVGNICDKIQWCFGTIWSCCNNEHFADCNQSCLCDFSEDSDCKGYPIIQVSLHCGVIVIGSRLVEN